MRCEHMSLAMSADVMLMSESSFSSKQEMTHTHTHILFSINKIN